MKIGILHLTDAHISSKNDFICSKTSKIVAAIKNVFEECEKIYIAFTGDIAKTGKKEEYIIAKEFLDSIRSLLKTLYSDKLYPDIIITPGNHDCDFSLDTQSRKLLLRELNYTLLGNDNSIIDAALTVQLPYTDFVKELNGDKAKERLFSCTDDIIGNHHIQFLCLNTAWMSQIQEQPGSLFFPIRVVNEKLNKGKDFCISMFHHHPAWMTPNTDENNRNEFTDFVNGYSDIALVGHEHQQRIEISGLLNETSINYFSGEALQNDANNSGFQILIIDIDTREGMVQSFSWKKEYYAKQKESSFELKQRNMRHREFHNSSIYLDSIESLVIPLGEKQSKTKIADLFVYPDLEQANDLNKEINASYEDSKRMLNSDFAPICILEGASQAGKTTLLKMIYLDALKMNLYPILICWEDIKPNNIDKCLQRAFATQYEDKSYELFSQFDNSQKIILIDNLSSNKFSNYGAQNEA